MGGNAGRPQDADVPTFTRRLAPLALILAIGASVAGLSACPVSAAALPAFDATTLTQARADLAAAVNAQRLAHGLIALQVDTGLTAMAATRAGTMASMDALGHAGPDGRTIFDAIRASGMTWYGAGEVIAFNTYQGEPESTSQAVADWLASPVHTSIVLSNDYNYVGLAAAVSATGNRYYAGVFMKLPDRTPGWAKAGTMSVAPATATTSRATVRWSGGDTRLQVLTAGLRDFEVQRRLAGGAWQSAGITTRSSMAMTLVRGRSYDIRIRSRDRAGNRSTWSQVTLST
jgi:uncharacterized protein YkwD